MPDVRTFVRDEVVRAAPGDSIAAVARLLDDETVGSVVIVDDGRPIGIVTDRDIAIAVAARGMDPETTPAADVMSEDLVTVDVESGIFDVIRAMRDASVRRIPAVDADGRLAGIVTFDDFVVLLGRELRNLGDVVEAEAPPYDHT